MTAEQVYQAALALPDDSKAALAERHVAHLETHVEPKVERAHLEVAKRRRDEILSGRVEALDGNEVMARGREIVAG